MTTDQLLPKDPEGAAQLLASLEEKDKQETVCRYPTCRANRVVATGTGRPSAYCSDHNAVVNHRARTALRATAAAKNVPSPEQQDPTGIVSAENLRTSIVNRITLLQSDLERYLTTLTQLADPDLSAAQMQAVLDQAEARIAEVQQVASSERSLRLAAETARAAAQEETHAEREAAQEAIEQMEVAESAREREREDAQQRFTSLQAEHAQSLDQIRAEAKEQQARIEKQAQDAIASAQAAATSAQEEAKQAEIRAEQARAQAATAERLIQEAYTSLERERAETDQARKELAATLAATRAEREADRAEARTVVERERAEVDHLRKELAATQARADHLAALCDELRLQLVEAQMGKKATS